MGEKRAKRPPQGRGSHGRFARGYIDAQRDAEAARLRSLHYTYQQIADELGFNDKGNAWHAVERALVATCQEPADAVRKLELERLDNLARTVQKILDRDHVTVSFGKVITAEDPDTGEIRPLPDDGPILQAVDRMLRIQARRASLLGLDAPTRIEAQVTEVTQQDLALQELVAELKMKNAVTEEQLRAATDTPQ